MLIGHHFQEQGIHVPNRAIRQRREQERRQAAAAASAVESDTASTSTTDDPTAGAGNNDNSPESSSSTTTTLSSSAAAQGSTAILYMPGRRIGRSNAAQNVIAQAQASSSSSSTSSKKKVVKKKRKSDDSDYEDSSGSETDDGTYVPASRPPRTKVVFCEKCKSRFSRSMSQNLDIQVENLCPNCREGGSPGSSKQKAPRKRARGLTRPGKELHKVLSLQDICIRVSSDHFYVPSVEVMGL